MPLWSSSSPVFKLGVIRVRRRPRRNRASYAAARCITKLRVPWATIRSELDDQRDAPPLRILGLLKFRRVLVHAVVDVLVHRDLASPVEGVQLRHAHVDVEECHLRPHRHRLREPVVALPHPDGELLRSEDLRGATVREVRPAVVPDVADRQEVLLSKAPPIAALMSASNSSGRSLSAIAASLRDDQPPAARGRRCRSARPDPGFTRKSSRGSSWDESTIVPPWAIWKRPTSTICFKPCRLASGSLRKRSTISRATSLRPTSGSGSTAEMWTSSTARRGRERARSTRCSPRGRAISSIEASSSRRLRIPGVRRRSRTS